MSSGQTRQRPLVGIVGGYGAAGHAVATHLSASGRVRLRIGGRDGSRAAAARRELGDGAEALAVDAYDPDSLAAFCRGCSVVAHTGGASYQVQDRVAVAALAAGAEYVDSGGDLPLLRRLEALDLAAAGRRALVTAGMMPGLSGLLPRWLAETEFARIDALTVYIGVVDHLSPAGAVDYLLSLAERDAESQAAWIGGAKVARALSPRADVVLPPFPGRVSVFPYLSYEAERCARQLGITDVRWHSVFDQGGNMIAALSRLQGAMAGQTDLAAAGRELQLAAELDLFGRRPYQLMVFEATGPDRVTAAERTRTLTVRSHSAAVLTGTVCGLAALSLLDGTIAPGSWLAAEALDPAELVAALRATPALSCLAVRDGPCPPRDEAVLVDEGAL